MSIAIQLSEIFVGSNLAHGEFRATGIEGKKIAGKAKTINKEATVDNWVDHVEGRVGLGLVPINMDNVCRFGAIDIDVYPVDYALIARSIHRYKMPLIPVKSKSGGLHLYMFTVEPTPAADLQKWLKLYAIKLGYGGSELFPKQTKIRFEQGDVGNWINMPYWNIGPDGTSDRCGVYPDGSLMTVDDFIKEAKEISLTEKQFAELEVRSMPPELLGGPPCLHTLIDSGIGSGMRNNAMTAIAIYLKKSKPNHMMDAALAINTKYFVPPLAEAEVRTIINSVSRKEYEYSCRGHLLKPLCDKKVCETRQFGITIAKVEKISLENLSKYDSDPPIWFVYIAGHGTRLELTTEELQTQSKFQVKCMNTLNILPPKLTNTVWASMMQKLLKEVTIISASDDTSARGQFVEWLIKFCTTKAQGRSLDEIMLGKPYTDDKKHYFRLTDLANYLSRAGFKDFKPNQMANVLIEQGGIVKKEKLRGVLMEYWELERVMVSDDKFSHGITKKEII